MKTRTCGHCGAVHPIPERKPPVPARNPWLCAKCSHRRWKDYQPKPEVPHRKPKPRAGCSRASAQAIATILLTDPAAWDRFSVPKETHHA